MKIAIITDLHFGVRKDDNLFKQKQLDWINNQFFPTIDKYNIKTVINMGDTFDNRLNVNIGTLNTFYDAFFKPLSERNIETYNIIGNHDAYYKDKNLYSVMRILCDTFQSFNLIQDELYELDNMVLCPWLSPENSERLMIEMDKLKSKDKYLLGHFQIVGMPIIGGLCQHGIEQSVFQGWKEVLSGHFHNPSNTNNIWYTGNPFFTTWADCGLNKGFVIYDTEDDEFTHIPTYDVVFHVYDLDDMDKTVCNSLQDQIVRIRVNGIDDNKKRLKTLMETLTEGNNVVDVVEIGDITDNVNIEAVIDGEHVDVKSKEFVLDVIDDIDIENASRGKVKQYLSNLMDKL